MSSFIPGGGGGGGLPRTASLSPSIGQHAKIKADVLPARIKVDTFTIIDPSNVTTKYNIVVPEDKKTEIIQKAQQMSPLFISESDKTNIAQIITAQVKQKSPRIYTWILIAEIDTVTHQYNPKLLVNEVMSRQEIGTAHIDMYYRYSTERGKEPDRVYLSGEFKAQAQAEAGKINLEFNLSSGTFMLDKFFKLKQQQQQQGKIDDSNIVLTEPDIIQNCSTFLQDFFPEGQFTITYTPKTFIPSSQRISLDEWDYLQELFFDNKTFLEEDISRKKQKIGGSRRKTTKTRTKTKTTTKTTTKTKTKTKTKKTKTKTKKTKTKKTKTKKTKTIN
jgi:hypothetical protein